MSKITNNDDVIDSRDVIERIDEIVTDLNDQYEQFKEEFQNEFPNELVEDFDTWKKSTDEFDELKILLNLQDQCKDFDEWEYGATLIKYDYFQDYCEEEVKELGYIPKDIPWWIEIDWKTTSENMAEDYTTVAFNDVIYYIRNC